MAVHLTKARRLAFAASIAAAFAAATPALSADMETILEKMHEKGLLTDEEYQEMRSQAREQRRREALEKATAEEKAAKAKEEEPSTLKGRFRDNFVFESGDKQHSISVQGRIHADFRKFDIDSTNANTADTFDIRRAYLGVTGKLYGDWTFEVTGDLASDSLEYAWVNYKQSDLFQYRIGALKMPFSYEELTSSRLIDFQERSLVNALAPGKEQGLMIHGAPTKWMSYAVAMSNGNGKEGDETNAVVDDKDILGRIAMNFATPAGIADTVLHLGLNYSTGTIPEGAIFAGGPRTEGRGLAHLTAIPAFDTISNEVDRERTGLEGILAWGPLKLQAEWVEANWSGTAVGGIDFDRSIDAYYAAISWLISGEKYADFYSPNGSRNLKPARPFKKGADGWGAWELGLRLSRFDAADFQQGPAGAAAGAIAASANAKTDAMTLGLKWIPNTNTRVYLNYVVSEFDRPIAIAGGTADEEKAITLRSAVFF
ncbi:MAG TPA: porin [Burkholderiales bacterium]|nr:porin [Burkholderiales bacterium]